MTEMGPTLMRNAFLLPVDCCLLPDATPPCDPAVAG